VNGRFVREYVGSGAVAERAAAQDQAERVAKAAKRAAEENERGKVAGARTLSGVFDREVKVRLHATMHAANFKLHARSQWRRTRMSTTTNQVTPDTVLEAMAHDAPDDLPSTEKLWEFLHHKHVPSADRPVGLGQRAEEAWIGLIVGADVSACKTLAEQLLTFRQGLGPADSPLERILIDQVSVTWLESLFFNNRAAEVVPEDATNVHRNFLHRAADRVQRRLVFLMKQLLTIQSLLREKGKTGNSSRQRVAGPKSK